MTITTKEQIADMYISWRMFMEEGLRRGYTFEKVDAKKRYMFRAQKDGRGFVYDYLPGFWSIKQRPDYPALEEKSYEKKLLDDAGMPVPLSYGSFTTADAVPFEKITYPVVAKPERSIQSKNAFVDLASHDALSAAIGKILAAKPGKPFVVEDMIQGNEYRIVVVDGVYCCAIERRSASVEGDGVSSIAQLIEERNHEPERSEPTSLLHTVHYLVYDAVSEELLTQQQLTKDSVLPKGVRVKIQKKVNAAIGTDYVDCTDRIHPSFTAACESFCKKNDFFIIGFDLICGDITKSMQSQKCAFNEFNFRPCVDLNENCNVGQKQPFSRMIWDALENKSAEIMGPDFPHF